VVQGRSAEQDPNFPPQSLGTGGFIDPKTGAPRYIWKLSLQGQAPIYSRTGVIIFLIHQCCSIRVVQWRWRDRNSLTQLPRSFTLLCGSVFLDVAVFLGL